MENKIFALRIPERVATHPVYSLPLNQSVSLLGGIYVHVDFVARGVSINTGNTNVSVRISIGSHGEREYWARIGGGLNQGPCRKEGRRMPKAKQGI